jgi:predicted  nucleic acid-binding Zn-ribbon protein
LKEKLKLLLQLQAVDAKNEQLEKAKELILEDIDALKERVNEKESELSGVKREYEEVTKEKVENEGMFESEVEVVNKYQAQLYDVKTNKEYTALLHEIEEKTKENSIREEKVLELMERMERLSDGIKGIEEAIKKELVDIGKKEQEGRGKIGSIDQEIERWMGERKAIVAQVDVELVERYERVRKNRHGLALVPVKDETCQGCFVELPPQVINDLMKGDKLMVCERCSRMLCWPDWE